MSVRPVDIKTSLLTADNASKIREDQKMQESGLAEQVSQNKHNQENKTKTVQNVENAESKVIRKEDEEEKKGGSSKKQKNRDPKDSKVSNNEEKSKIQDGIHGLFDLKA